MGTIWAQSVGTKRSPWFFRARAMASARSSSSANRDTGLQAMPPSVPPPPWRLGKQLNPTDVEPDDGHYDAGQVDRSSSSACESGPRCSNDDLCSGPSGGWVRHLLDGDLRDIYCRDCWDKFLTDKNETERSRMGPRLEDQIGPSR